MENKRIQGTEQLVLNAKLKVFIKNLDIDGDKPGTNVNAKIYLDCEELVVKDSNILNTCVAYNIFELRQTVNYPLKNVKVDNLTCDDINLKHNAFSLYNFANNANILIQNSIFNLNVDNSNVMRLSNYKNALNVTIHFKNVSWTYEAGAGTDFSWAGLIIYQPAGADSVLTGDLTTLKTWTFIFENCYYNGTKITNNNFGEHSLVMYLYNVNKDGKTTDPMTQNLNIEFK